MKLIGRRFLSVVAVGLVAALGAAACSSSSSTSGSNKTDVEVFTWWVDGSDRTALPKLVGQFETDCPGYNFVDGAVSAHNPGEATQILARRAALNNLPDTFQVHAGYELADFAGKIEDLSAEYQEWGLTNVFPQGLIDNLTVDGKIYSVPVNIHRTNVLWGNKTVLASAGITADATSLDAFLTDLDKLKNAGCAHATSRCICARRLLSPSGRRSGSRPPSNELRSWCRNC
jgi:glucose/mannose transport system substrate-binding protein